MTTATIAPNSAAPLPKITCDIYKLTVKVCRNSFWQFVRNFWDQVPGFQPIQTNWHMEYLCNELQDVAERIFKGKPKKHDLLVNISPNTSKSTLCSILFPAWNWTRMPGCRHIAASHTETLVLDLATKSRAVIESELYQRCFPEIKLRKDQDTKMYFANTLGGDRVSCTVGGKSPTGFHAHVLILDDAVNPQNVLSEPELQNASNFTYDVLMTRKIDKRVSVFIGIMQRLHPRDPSGVILDRSKTEGADPLKHICLPAEEADNISPPELREKYIDGLMDPVRLSRQALLPYKINKYVYAGQFMQMPTPKGGGMFQTEWFNSRKGAAPREAQRIRYWDRACLVAGTKIETMEGQKSIELVCTGDMVLTRQGHKRVKWAGQTKKVNEVVSVLFSNGSVITGTYDHLIWTNNYGWVKLGLLCCGCYRPILKHGENSWEGEESLHRIQKELCSTEFGIRGDLEKDISKRCGGTSKRKNISQIRCIGRCGDSTMEIFPLGMISITKMITGTITPSIIWNVFHGKNTTKNTEHSRNGIKQRLQQNITRGSARLHGRMPSIRSVNAYSVERSSNRGEFPDFLDIALLCVENVIERGLRRKCAWHVLNSFTGVLANHFVVHENVQKNTCKQSALFAEPHFKESEKFSDAVVRVVGENGDGRIPVYDIEVEDAHEFFANGVLVHNSTQNDGCYTAGVLVARGSDGDFYIEHVVHGQWEPTQRNKKIKAAALRDRVRYGPRFEPLIVIEREGGSSGRDAWKDIVRVLAGFSVKEDSVSGSKDARAEPLATQFEAGVVHLVEDGSWDINKYVQEFENFRPMPGKRISGYADQIDATTGAINILLQVKKGGLKVIELQAKKKKKTIQIIACSREELFITNIKDSKCLLVNLRDPSPRQVYLEGRQDTKIAISPPQDPSKEEITYPMQSLLGTLDLELPNLDPKDFQDKWEEEILTYQEKPETLVMTREHGKKLWAFLLTKRASSPEVLVFCDEGDGRALSVALAVCDILRFPRKSTIYCPGSPDTALEGASPPNDHMYQITKSTRNMVIG